jgi:hypothetical protein
VSIFYVVETNDGIAINVIPNDSLDAAQGVFEVLARQNIEDNDDAGSDLEGLELSIKLGIYADGDYTISILEVP